MSDAKDAVLVARDADDVREFLTEGRAYLDSVEPILAQMQQSDGDQGGEINTRVASIFRAFHSIKGVAGFLSFGNVQEVTHKAEETLDRVRTGKRAFDRELGGVLLESCDFLRSLFQSIESIGEDLGSGDEQASLVARLKVFCTASQARQETVEESDIGSAPGQGWLYPWLLSGGLTEKFRAGINEIVGKIEACLIGLLDSPNNAGLYQEAAAGTEALKLHASAFGFPEAVSLAANLIAALKRSRPAGSSFDPAEISVLFGACNALKLMFGKQEDAAETSERGKIAEGELKALLVEPAAAKSAEPAAAAAPAQNGAGPKSEIRVSLDKLDKMVDLIEELGVISTGIVYTAESSEDGDGLRQSASKLRQITEELQEITVSIRMVPLSTVFRKMIRLVGDVSGKLGKKARLEIVGEETELDKDAVESLQDPLVHILRNCVDHGLEMPDERAKSGKPVTGVVRLQAWHSGSEAWISISDDGRGISKEKVLAKAVAQGLVAANAAVDDAEILSFIFHPGFSLAKEVTEFSGRGVGMDVVKKNIQSLKGRVDIESKVGEGSTFLIRLPLANALTESMLVRVGSIKYVLRVASIRETFRPDLSAVTRLPNGDEMVRLRGRLYPIIRLHVAHSVPDAEVRLDCGLIVIVENRGKQTGIFVDEVLGKIQAVIKPPPSLLKASRTVSGCSIIGTDSNAVALALDINALDEKFASLGRN